MEILSVLAISFIMVFVAELGDKSQFMAIIFSLRYSRKKVLIGISLAALFITCLAVLLGKILLSIISPTIMDAISIIVMLFFSLQTLSAQESTKNDISSQKSSHLEWFTVALAFIAAELGDKTMFTAANLALKYPPWIVWPGAALGLIVSNSLVLLVNKSVLKKIKLTNLKLLAGLAFIIFTIWQTYTLELSWSIKLSLIIIEGLLFALVLVWRTKRFQQKSESITGMDLGSTLLSELETHSELDPEIIRP